MEKEEGVAVLASSFMDVVHPPKPPETVVAPTTPPVPVPVPAPSSVPQPPPAQVQQPPAPPVEEMEDEEDNAESDIESWNSEDDPDRLWCICKKPHNNR